MPGSGVQSTLRDVVERVRRLLDVLTEPVWGSFQARVWDTSCWVADARRSEELLGWRATTLMDEGLVASAAWLRSTAAVRERYFSQTNR